MSWNARHPSWMVGLWLMVLSRFNDGTTAAAFVVSPFNPTKSTLLPITAMTAATLSNEETTTKNTAPSVSSVTRFHLPDVASNGRNNPWDQLVPPLLQAGAKQSKGCDVALEWTHQEDSVQDVARAMLYQCGLLGAEDVSQQMTDYLADCLSTFVQFVQEHLHLDNPQQFRARLVATRGPAGTKCPRWHVDHVPVRWIQSLVGPGCDYVVDAQTTDTWWLWEEHEEEGSERPPLDEIVCELPQRQAKEQEVILLAGNRWNEFALQPLPPAIHKSPELPLWQGRVLLTIDVLVPYAEDEEDDA